MKSHAIKIKFHGKFGAENLKTCSLLGKFFIGLANYLNAEEYLQSVFDLQERRLGPYHDDTIESAQLLESLYEETSRLEEAEKMQRLVVEGYKKPLAEGHVLTLTAMSCLRTLLYVQQKYDEARVLQVANQKEMSKFDSMRVVMTRCWRG